MESIQRLLSALIFIIILIVLNGCTAVDTQQTRSITTKTTANSLATLKPVQTNAITLKDIKKKYKNRTVISITPFYDYVLVESQNPGETANEFDWYNMKTGQKNILPTYTDVAELYRIIDPNHIVLLANGSDSNSAFKVFPYYIYCLRGFESNDFQYPIYRSKYFPLDHSVQFGLKPDEVINDMKVTLNGIQILFGSAKGKEGEFYADDTTIPVTNTSYNATNHTFTISFKKTTWNPKFLLAGLKKLDQNQYIDSVQISEKGANSIVLIKTKKLSNYYNGSIKKIHDGLPFVEFTFYDKDPSKEWLNVQ